MSWFSWLSIVCILAAAMAGGALPLLQPERARGGGFARGRAFSSGVFLALSLLLMLPSAIHLAAGAFPGSPVPVAELCAASIFVVLLYLEQSQARAGQQGTSLSIVLIMTAMIAAPSFLLGTALGMSASLQAVLIFAAILAHKGSAGFALAIKIVDSQLSRAGRLWLYGLFALSTPLGIVAGSLVSTDMQGFLAREVRALIFALAAGVFFYMAVMHDLRDNPMAKECANRGAFLALLAGFALTAIIRLALGEAQRLAAS